MELGAFSVSLNVADLEASEVFYAKLGFETTGGSHDQSYLIMKNGSTLIGLFHGMFDKTILTFNPGLGQDAERLGSYTDVREIQAQLKEAGIALVTEAKGEKGAASITLEDPDGNPILIDQFF